MKNNYRIFENNVVIFLKRKNGEILETVIDLQDFQKANEYKGTWYALRDPKSGKFYVYGNLYISKGKRRGIKLHRWLMGEPCGFVIDHINHDTLDNRRVNLRAVKQRANIQNSLKPLKTNKSGFRGVSWDESSNKWRAQISINKKVINLGRFSSKQKAHAVYLKAKKKYHKEGVIS
ncbi:endonuclease subunit [Bacillus phage vB_Bacillus_1020A]|jgi:hypothetical protein|uniref:HNH endonuclease n=1 Tax=Robertmurraya sp. DFI.2.37 TaxID=3031819 RepID=UPI001246429B|nr:HNH endonuclease [Robertmurraya sp. DFI.2.37]MDF1511074.1 AP2 domain-containing protein [Robertmurraya sp. DFI.2.37]QIW89345.1 endonuclease subunit [Bacillus phage vB_Bacillus_1020A]